MSERVTLEFTEEELLAIDAARGTMPLLVFCYAAVYERASWVEWSPNEVC